MKRPWVIQCANRREFLRGSLRNVSLAGVAALTALLVRRPSGRSGNARCVNRSICDECAVFANCRLPPALSTRRSLQEELM